MIWQMLPHACKILNNSYPISALSNISPDLSLIYYNGAITSGWCNLKIQRNYSTFIYYCWRKTEIILCKRKRECNKTLNKLKFFTCLVKSDYMQLVSFSLCLFLPEKLIKPLWGDAMSPAVSRSSKATRATNDTVVCPGNSIYFSLPLSDSFNTTNTVI